jgi:hypothetical protein
MQTAQTTATATTHDDRYADFLSGAQERFGSSVAASPHLFTTDAAGLWEAYLSAAPEGTRQSRTCNACKSFIEKFGGLVSIAADGSTASAVWPKDAPPLYADAARALTKLVERADVTGVFRAKESIWGHPVTGPWTHLSLSAPPSIRWIGVVTTAGQEMAAKAEEHKMLARSLAEFDVETVRKTVALLTGDSLYRSEKCVGVARWLLDLHESLAATKSKRARTNILWLAVAKAPAGYCHVRSGMIGTLLEDVVAELPFEIIKRKFTEKMDPLQYMRPQAPPSAGNIAQAEKIVAALQAQGSLERRFAKLADVQALWLPRVPVTRDPAPGIFGHLAKLEVPKVTTSDAPATTMTWVKFLANVLPTAEAIDFLVPHDRQAYTAMVTAKNADAPNLLQWDNPVSHYVYSSGSPPSQWNLPAGQYRRVTAVVLRSWMWDAAKAFEHHGAGVCFVLEGAKDTTYVRSGGMFPEQMKSEYHGVRRTLEAYFANAAIEGKDEAEVCGIALVKGQTTWNLTFRVTSRGMRTTYKLDRWD